MVRKRGAATGSHERERKIDNGGGLARVGEEKK